MKWQRPIYRTKITVSAEAYALIRAASDSLDESETTVLPDGRRTLSIDGETIKRLAEISFLGETPSDTIIRAFAAYNGKDNN